MSGAGFDVEGLQGGFAQSPIDAAHGFRAAMQAMARPGRIEQVKGAQPPAPMSVAAGVLVLTLCDPETPIHLAGPLDCASVRDWIAFHTGAPVVQASQCCFAIGTWEHLLPLEPYVIGTPEYPDRSATLIVEMPDLTHGAILSGPGIKDHASLSLPDIAPFQRNATLFPLGLDFFFCAEDRVAALPRTTKVHAANAPFSDKE